MSEAVAVNAGATAPSRSREIIAATIGTFFEWFDLLIYASFAVLISRLFFPTGDPVTSLSLSLLTFASSYLIRPFGALIIGAYADRSGRRAALVLSSLLMMIGTLITAILPSYASIGATAPVLLVVARLIQGFSAGGEFGSANTYLSEQNPKHKSFYGSLQFAATGLAIVLASTFAYVLTKSLTQGDLESWGWRIPFFFGLLIGPVAWYIRTRVDESPEFSEAKASQTPIREALAEQKYPMLVGFGIVAAGNVASYVNIYMPTYAITQLKLEPTAAFVGGISGGLVSTFFPMLGGYLADRYGNVPVMRAALITGIIIVYPLFMLLQANPTVATLALVQAAIGLVFYSFYYAPVGGALTQLFPARCRTTCSSISYVASQTFFGGITPVVVTWLIATSGNPKIPGLYLSAIGLIGLLALSAGRRLGMR
jgi:MHS family proline/betaine transporter-like MFS transporter